MQFNIIDHHNLLIVVKSSPLNEDRRNVIRATWGSVTKVEQMKISTIFLIGFLNNSDIMSLTIDEHEFYGDILYISDEDNYRQDHYCYYIILSLM